MQKRSKETDQGEQLREVSRRVGLRWGIVDWAIAIIVAVCAMAVYGNAVKGEFVYDDNSQIVKNPLIQRPDMVWRALTSDVWAFRGAVAEPGANGGGDAEGGPRGVSNYYRPVFVGFLILEHRMFGLGSAKPWHVASLFLHAIVCVQVFVVARRILTPRNKLWAGVIALGFAVHPVHVESVTWVSGSPDLLMAAGILLAMSGAILFVDRGRSPQRMVVLVAAAGMVIVGSLIAVGSKEVGVMVAPLVGLTGWAFAWRANEERVVDQRKGWAWPAAVGGGVMALPLIVSVLFLVARSFVVGSETRTLEQAASWESMLASLPRVGVFYVRECLWPWENLWNSASAVGPGGVAAAHPVRPVDASLIGTGAGVMLFWVPLAIAAALVLVFLWPMTRSVLWLREARAGHVGSRDVRDEARETKSVGVSAMVIGLAIFVLTLLPAMYIRAFPPEHIVRDRYLYFPLFGLLLAMAAWGMLVVRRPRPSTVGWACAAGIAVVCIALSVKTWKTSEYWLTERSLWTAAARQDPTAMTPLTELGRVLSLNDQDLGALNEALTVYTKAVEKHRMVAALAGRAGVLLKLTDLEVAKAGADKTKIHAKAMGQYRQAESDARAALSAMPGVMESGSGADGTSQSTFDHLAVALERQGKLVDSSDATTRNEMVSAEGVLRRSRAVHSFAYASITQRLAVVLYVAGKKREAKAELEGALEVSRKELTLAAPLVSYRLALVCAEAIPADTQSNPARPAVAPDFTRAVHLLREFMQRTKPTGARMHPMIETARKHAESILAKVPPGSVPDLPAGTLPK